jgi:hypothetical protein
LGTFRSDQGAIWNGVSMLASNLKAESPGMAMSEIYRKNAPSIGKYVGHFGLADGQAGAVFMINGQVAGMDCFGKPETFSKVFKKLVESYALDAIDSLRENAEKELKAAKSDAARFLEAAAGCRVEAHQSVGLGIDCRLDTDQSTGFALAHEDRVLHLSLFAKAAQTNTEFPGSRMIRFSHRRRRIF